MVVATMTGIKPYWESMTLSSACAHGNAMAREALAKNLGA